jgi:hypothetical protein
MLFIAILFVVVFTYADIPPQGKKHLCCGGLAPGNLASAADCTLPVP